MPRLYLNLVQVKVDGKEEKWKPVSGIIKKVHRPRVERVNEYPEAKRGEELVYYTQLEKHTAPFPKPPYRVWPIFRLEGELFYVMFDMRVGN